jgi:chromosome partitioning protein
MSGGSDPTVSRETESAATSAPKAPKASPTDATGGSGFGAYNSISPNDTPIGAAAHRASQILHPGRRIVERSPSRTRRAAWARLRPL